MILSRLFYLSFTSSVSTIDGSMDKVIHALIRPCVPLSTDGTVG